MSAQVEDTKSLVQFFDHVFEVPVPIEYFLVFLWMCLSEKQKNQRFLQILFESVATYFITSLLLI